MNRLRIVAFLAALLVAGTAMAEGPNYIDLSALPEGEQFAFLLGEWTYEFTTGHGTASYVSAAGDTAVREVVEGVIQKKVFTGSSLTVWDAGKSHYRRKWIDTLGNTLDGSAVMSDYEESDLPAMISSTELNGIKLKHVWYNITKDRFETDLLASNDGGETYKLIRRMPYIRTGS